MADKESVVLLPFKDGTKLDEMTFARFAEGKMSKEGKGGVRELAFHSLTTSKLRNIYGLIMNLYTKMDSPLDFEKSKGELQYLKVKMAYEAGREQAVKEFLSKTHLMTAISYIKTYEQFLLYCRYAESLVAYFKYYGGRDN